MKKKKITLDDVAANFTPLDKERQAQIKGGLRGFTINPYTQERRDFEIPDNSPQIQLYYNDPNFYAIDPMYDPSTNTISYPIADDGNTVNDNWNNPYGDQSNYYPDPMPYASQVSSGNTTVVSFGGLVHDPVMIDVPGFEGQPDNVVAIMPTGNVYTVYADGSALFLGYQYLDSIGYVRMANAQSQRHLTRAEYYQETYGFTATEEDAPPEWDFGVSADGYSWDGYDQNGYDASGYDQSGYDSSGYNAQGYDQSGFNSQGFSQNGTLYDDSGFDKNGYNANGFDENGTTADGSNYNSSGYNADGYNASGFDASGFTEYGCVYNSLGYNAEGYTAAEQNAQNQAAAEAMDAFNLQIPENDADTGDRQQQIEITDTYAGFNTDVDLSLHNGDVTSINIIDNVINAATNFFINKFADNGSDSTQTDNINAGQAYQYMFLTEDNFSVMKPIPIAGTENIYIAASKDEEGVYRNATTLSATEGQSLLLGNYFANNGAPNFNAIKGGDDSNQADGMSHDQELSKYGKIITSYNLSAGASLAQAGATVETGVIMTDKGWARAYKTIYYSPGFNSPSGALGFSVVSQISDEYSPTFRDWKGSMVGFSGSVDFIAGNVGFTSAYSVYGLGLSAAPESLNIPAMNGINAGGSMNLGDTSWIGDPFQVGNLNLSGADQNYLNTAQYQGGY